MKKNSIKDVKGEQKIKTNTSLTIVFVRLDLIAKSIYKKCKSIFETPKKPRDDDAPLFAKRCDVLVGSLGSVKQLEDNLKRNYYYVPARTIRKSDIPVKYIALYQSKNMFENEAGIRYYGEVLSTKRVIRKEIGFSMRKRNPHEPYYSFVIKEWKMLDQTIVPLDAWVNEPKFTHFFLLTNCQNTFELFSVKDSEDYLLLQRVKQGFEYLSDAEAEEEREFQLNDMLKLVARGIYIYLYDFRGREICRFDFDSFEASPKITFETIKKYAR